MVVTDPGVIQTELTKPIEFSLQAGGIDFVVYDGVEPEPPHGSSTAGLNFSARKAVIRYWELAATLAGMAFAVNQSRLFVPNPRDLSEEDVRAIFQAAY